ncbi:hypothetical protein [Streptomyces sp. NRRL S-1448]|uniref:hypothetical protein n=1 Tax=Streptomyces sp. NRRL S-1448 TaxID=1463883 RepID=UPI00131E9CC9|nr:hypothetical protein [Streptomyces sp. NRRL S-1448]
MPDLPTLSPGRFTPSGFGLRWWSLGDGDGLGVHFDLPVQLGGLRLSLPGAGFDFSLPDTGSFSVNPWLRELSMSVGGVELAFTVPNGPGLPELPGLPTPGC